MKDLTSKLLQREFFFIVAAQVREVGMCMERENWNVMGPFRGSFSKIPKGGQKHIGRRFGGGGGGVRIVSSIQF